MKYFCSKLYDVVKSVLSRERVVIGADFNGHVGDEVLGRYAVMDRNTERQIVVDLQKGWEWVW